MDAALQKTLLKRMMLIRAFEETVGKLFYQGKIPGFIHVSIGQEACAVGVCAALKEDDYISTTHRGHGDIIAKGADLNRMMAEIFGRRDGLCGGKGGSMHVSERDRGILGANGIVGAGLPIATGGALSAKMEGRGRVSVCFFGDGATNEGTFHESLNLASLWKLPAVFVCQNNGYGEFTPVADASAMTEIWKRAAAYNMPGVYVDGNDVEAVYEAAAAAVAQARAGHGPTLLDCATYRWFGHFHGEEALLAGRKYRDPEEIQRWKERDPVAGYRRKLIAAGVLSEAEAGSLAAEAQKEIDSAVQFATASPVTPPEDALKHVFAEA